MIRDITIGQYYPAESRIHRLDPRVKIVCTLLFSCVVVYPEQSARVCDRDGISRGGHTAVKSTSQIHS